MFGESALKHDLWLVEPIRKKICVFFFLLTQDNLFSFDFFMLHKFCLLPCLFADPGVSDIPMLPENCQREICICQPDLKTTVIAYFI
jgi:hypothetical protein